MNIKQTSYLIDGRPHRQTEECKRDWQINGLYTLHVQCVSGGIVNILGGGSMDYSE